MLVCLPVCGFVSGNRARLARAADSDVLRPARRIHIRLRGRVLHNSPRRSPAHPSSDRLRGSLRSGDTIPHTCAVSPTFRYGAFFFVVFALAAFLSARLTAYNNHATNTSRRQQSACLQVPNYRFKKSRTTQYREFATSTPMLTSIKHIDRFHPSADITVR